MTIYLANGSKQLLGGGFSFLRYFEKYAPNYITESYDTSNVYFISGCTMVSRDDVAKAKEDGKKIVLRVDNIPKNSRNRNTSVSRLRDFASIADLVVYQSEWAKEYAGYVTKKDGPIIYNGVDTEFYTEHGPKWPKKTKTVYLYSRFNRDESKRPDEALYEYHMAWRKDKDIELWLMGKFSKETIEYRWDLFDNEPMQYLGIYDNPEQMAMFYRSADYLLVPYYNDACSNTVIEFLQCGHKAEDVLTCTSGMTGGTPEILRLAKEGYDFSAKRMADNYISEIEKL